MLVVKRFCVVVACCLVAALVVVRGWLSHGDDSKLSEFLTQCSFGTKAQVVAYLNRRSALLEAVDDDGMTCLINASKEGRLDIVNELISRKVEMNQPNAIHQALRGAAIYGHLEVCKALLDAGAEVDAFSFKRKTALMGAVRNGHRQIASLLLQHGADCTLRNEYQETAQDLWVGGDHDKIC